MDAPILAMPSHLLAPVKRRITAPYAVALPVTWIALADSYSLQRAASPVNVSWKQNSAETYLKLARTVQEKSVRKR